MGKTSCSRIAAALLSLHAVFGGASAFAGEVPGTVVDCEHPLLKRMSETIPLFRSGYDVTKTLPLFRGVKEPQFDRARIIRYLFQDPWIYSAGKMIDTGQSGPIQLTKGSWRAGESEEENTRNFTAWFDDAVAQTTGQNLLSKDGSHPIWQTRTLPIYDTQPYYNWVEFASPDHTIAKGYGRFVLGLDVPVARTHPGASGWETVVPLLLAPWEVREVTDYEGGTTVLRKVFNHDGGAINRCAVDGIEIVGTGTYLSLCPDDNDCDQDARLLPTAMQGFAKTLFSLSIEGRKIGIGRDRPESSLRCENRFPAKSQAEFDGTLAKIDADARSRRVRSILRGSAKVPAVRCQAEMLAYVGFWKASPEASWDERMILGRELKDTTLLTNGIAGAFAGETPYDTFEDRLATFAIRETELTRKGLVRELVATLEAANATDAIPATAMKRLYAAIRPPVAEKAPTTVEPAASPKAATDKPIAVKTTAAKSTVKKPVAGKPVASTPTKKPVGMTPKPAAPKPSPAKPAGAATKPAAKPAARAPGTRP